MMFISLFRSKDVTDIKDEYKDNNSTIVRFFIAPWLALLVGVIVKGFIS